MVLKLYSPLKKKKKSGIIYPRFIYSNSFIKFPASLTYQFLLTEEMHFIILEKVIG